MSIWYIYMFLVDCIRVQSDDYKMELKSIL